MAQPWLYSTSPGRPSPFRVALFASLLLLLLEPQPVAAQTNYTVNQAYDLAYAFWSKADIIYIYDSIQITLDNFPTTSVTMVSLALQKGKATATAHAVCLPARCDAGYASSATAAHAIFLQDLMQVLPIASWRAMLCAPQYMCEGSGSCMTA